MEEEAVGLGHGDEILWKSNIPPLLLLLIPILFSTIFILRSHLKKKNKPTFPLPPGPWKLPIIGNIHQLAAFSAGVPIHRRFADLAEQYGPIMHLKLGETSNVIISSPESAREFLRTHDQNFAARPYLPSADIIFYGSKDIAFCSEGDYWRQMRKILTMELLTDKRVKSFRPILEAEASKLMNLIGSEPAGGVVNLSRLLVSVGNAMTSRTAFGKIRGLEGSFLPVIHRILQALGGFSVGDIFPSNRLLRLISGTERHLKKLHQEADVILQGIIDEHVSRRRNRETEHLDKAVATGGEEEEDLVDVLLACTDNHLEVKAVILDIFLAGGDTSPVTVEWAMSELMKNPEKMNKVQREVREMFDKRGKVVDDACFNELHYLKSVVKETFRLHPPVPLSIPREGRETVVINGCQIPAKTRIIVNSWAIGRNSSHWTQPDQFIPERFLNSSIDYKGNDFQLIPFGAGRRMCPGMNYGIFVVYLLLANLLYHFDWKLPNQIKPQDLDMSEDSGGTVPRKNNLYLNSIPYHAP
ncbi:unnamed protein product [Linum tenue]|uniref:Cytochrome P450 n=1 Tax=Linum tenue TaxID=586396 RepID=A0AAV0KYE7_9ROSI|nr:unnamed protein product [Linum tenue]